MRYTIPVGTFVIRWVKDADGPYLRYSGWGVKTKKLVTYDETDMAPIWRHYEFCHTYSWEPDKYFTFYLPAAGRPWRFVTVLKHKVKATMSRDDHIKALGLGMKP